MPEPASGAEQTPGAIGLLNTRFSQWAPPPDQPRPATDGICTVLLGLGDPVAGDSIEIGDTIPMSHIVLDHPLVHHKLTLLRDRKTSGSLFRQLVEEVGLLLAVEATKDLVTESVAIETPLEHT
jgi:hypothetical protein